MLVLLSTDVLASDRRRVAAAAAQRMCIVCVPIFTTRDIDKSTIMAISFFVEGATYTLPFYRPRRRIVPIAAGAPTL